MIQVSLRIRFVLSWRVGNERTPRAEETHAVVRLERVTSAAFFDLDRTLLRRSSTLALAGSFRERGVIGRTQLAKAAFWQLLFAARGASVEAVRHAAEDGMLLLKGFPVAELRDMVAGAMEPVLKPLVYAEPLALATHHSDRGERTYIVSAALQEIVDALATELGFDGAIGSTCEIVDGVYTGKSVRAAHGEGKAAATRELAVAEGIDLAASTAYSDSHTDIPFLEVVGHPVAVNPDKELRRVAGERAWPVLEFSELLVPSVRKRMPAAVYGLPLVIGVGAAAWAARRRAA
jgi:HAD superfamily hydrolase (TIGR01490 family)